VIARLNAGNPRVWHAAHVVVVWRGGKERGRRVDTACGIKTPESWARKDYNGQPNCKKCIAKMQTRTRAANAERAEAAE
jgi:hypothetical protein